MTVREMPPWSDLLSYSDLNATRSDADDPDGGRQTLGDELDPIQFHLNFVGGGTIRVDFVGSGNEPSAFWLVMQAFKQLATLPPNWDSYGANALHPNAVIRSFNLLPVLLMDGPPHPSIAPCRDGGIQFEWHRSGIDLEVSVPPSGPISCFVSGLPGDPWVESEGPIDRDMISLAFARMSSDS